MGLIVRNVNFGGKLRGTFPQVPPPPPAPNIVTLGLIMNLDAGNAASYPGSGNTWVDISGNDNNGTLVNGPTYNSDNNGSIVFDGNDDYGSVPSSQFQSGNNPFSMEVWFRWAGNGVNSNNVLFGYGADTGPNKVPVMGIISNLVQFSFGSDSGATNSSAIQTNNWYQALATYDQSFNKIYLNSQLSNTTSYSSAAVDLNGYNGLNAGIGCLFSIWGNVGPVWPGPTGPTGRYGTFNGNIAIVRYYNRALNQSEVTQNFNALRGRYGI